jgi:ATP-dependent DNA helicase PIF1
LWEVLTGPAGCGKTWAAREYVRASADGSSVLASSTGISAVNLGGEATTINSLLGYFDEGSLRDKILAGRVQGMLRGLRKAGMRRIILDEVSMISGETLDLLYYAINEVNKDRGRDDLDVEYTLNEPIGLTLVGDFCQLPPVKGKYAFEAGCWEEAFAPHIHKLTRIWRQDDPTFVEALRAARRADVPKVVEYFGPGTQLVTDEAFDGVTVFGTNAEVNRWNDFQHLKLQTRPIRFETKRFGQQKPEWKAPDPSGRGGGHIPDFMGIKPGARVMILANEHDRENGGLVYSNGDLGTFEGITEQEMEVAGEWQLVQMAVVRLMRNHEQVGIPEVRRVWETPSGALGVKKPKMDILGWVKYMPIRLAYASSVHKTQGLSMDRVQIAIAHRFFASPAMLYVALSRARSMAGLRLVGTPQLIANRCTVDPKVQRWL